MSRYIVVLSVLCATVDMALDLAGPAWVASEKHGLGENSG